MANSSNIDLLNNPIRFLLLKAGCRSAFTKETTIFIQPYVAPGEGRHDYSVAINTGTCSLAPFLFLCMLSESQMKDGDLSPLAFKTL